MKRRDLLKSCLVAPFVGLFKGKKKDIPFPSDDQSQPSNSSDSMEDEFCQDPNCPYCNGAINPYLANSRQRFPLGTRLVTSGGIPHRYVKSSPNTKIFGKKLTRPIYFWISENQWIFDNSGDFIKS